MNFKFAIVDNNVLTCLGLKQLLEDIIPVAEIDVYTSFDEMKSDVNSYIHFFVGSRLYFENAGFFRQHPHKTIVLVAGEMLIAGVMTLNVCQSEQALAKSLIKMQSRGHSPETSKIIPKSPQQDLLSHREVEVAVLLSKGYINKEIADQLNISVTTVISHRKNIMEKLHARSLADIIIYCVMNGLVDAGEI